MTSYAKRASLFEKGEQTWTVTPEALLWSLTNGRTLSLPWRDVRTVRLGFEPTRLKSDRYVLSLTTRGGRRWTVDSLSFVGIGNFEDRSAAFTPLVLACVERVAALSPRAKARLGASVGAYWGQLLLVGTLFVVLVAVLILLPTRHSGIFWVKGAIVLASLPLLAQWIRRARPRKTTLDVEAFREALP